MFASFVLLLTLSQSQVKLSGTIVDPAGNPIPNVLLGHVRNPNDPPPTTDSHGQFNLTTDSKVVVFRRPGFRSVRLPLRPAPPTNMVFGMTPSPPNRRDCLLPESDYVSLGALFRIRLLPGFSATKQGYDTDYAYRRYTYPALGPDAFIRHGDGLRYTDGVPNYQRVHTSVQFREIAWISPNQWLHLDSRGVLPDGTYWRMILNPREALHYENQPRHIALVLDRLLDTLCFAPPSPRPTKQ